MSSQEHEGSGDDLDLNLLSMLTKHVFPYYIRSGLVGKKKERKKKPSRPISLRGWTPSASLAVIV